jgi:sugar phosphate isomerase/epimerase
MTMATPLPDMVATCWTSAGNVMPTRTGDRSPVDIKRRVRAVAAAGYRGFGINHADLVAARDRIGLSGLAELFGEHGIVHVELELGDYWWTSGQRRADSDHVRRDLLAAAPILGAKHIKVGVGFYGDTYDPELLRTEFATLASEAADVDVKIALEPCAFSMMPSLATAVDVITDVAHPNGGLLLDIWHIYRSGMDYPTMAEIVPTEHLFGVELDDGASEMIGSGLEDTFDNRVLCGEGDFDVLSFIQAVHTLGYLGPWGVEMMSHQHRTLEPEEATARAYDAAQRCLALAAAPDTVM